MTTKENISKNGLLTIAEVCLILEINRHTLYHLRQANLLVAEPTTNGKVLFNRIAVQTLFTLMNKQPHSS
jgi:DNA-binding transcriptional MerR regulator